MNWWGHVKERLLRLGSGGADAPLQVRAEGLNRVLERERTRADRTGRPLSMVLLGSDGERSGRDDAELIVEVMRTRGRITDEFGRFDRRTGYAVLPDTPAAGGRRFADLVREQLRGRGVKASFAVYQYHPAAQDAAQDQGPDDRDGGPPGGGRREAAVRPSITFKPVDDARPRRKPAVATARQTADDPDAVHDLGVAMARGLPWWKRGTDLAVAGSLLLALWPVMAVIAAAVRLDSPGPAVFRQQRSGLGGRPFEILKFRTMIADAEAKRDALLRINEQDGPAFKIRADPRITRVGSLLRKTSLDELPQLINVLRGEMTLVGPRPLPVRESEACAAWQKRRLDVTPGLTCIWQVWGRSGVTFDQWCRMDLRYRNRRTPKHDLWIMLCTVPAVIKQRGAC
ncbi:MAG: sugar transferase [Planctomycetota bacterium]